jgi:autotransporter-associated beta strand protein
MKKLNTISKIRGALKQFTLGLAVSAAVVLGSGLTANAAAPPNDNFADAIDLPGASGTQTGTDTIDATLQAGEPNPGATNTVWFKWTCTADGALTVDTFGSTDLLAGEWDAILGIYTGTSLNALTPLGTTPQDTGYAETMTVPVTAGTIYYIQLAGWNNTVAGFIQLNWTLVETIYQADFLTFGPGGVIDQGLKTIVWGVPLGANPATLAPTFTLSPGATCTVGGLPVHSGDPVNLTLPVVYTVTAKGSSPTVNDYTVTVAFVPTLIWNTTSGDWDFTTDNWIEQTSGTSQLFADGLFVIFNNPLGGAINITSAVLPLSTTVSNGDYTISGGPIDGTGSLTKTGSGTLTLDSANSYSGNTVVNGGTLVANGSSAVAGTTSFNVAGGATLVLSGSVAGAAWPAATVTGAGTVSMPLAGGGNVGLNLDMSAFTGILDITNGMMAVNPFYSPLFRSPTNGTIKVEDRTTLYLGWTGFSLNSTVALYGGTDNGEGYGVLRGDNATQNGAVILGANSTIGCAGGTFTINGVISDGGNGFGFAQVQSGTVVLTATNTYSGPTTVNAGGTLQCNNPGALGSGALSINTGGKVNLNYSGVHTAAAVTLGGVPQTGGTYGSSISGATHTNDTFFSGTGVVRPAPSKLNNMLTFSFGALGSATINGTNITMLVPGGTDVTHLAPTYTVSPGATGSPVSGTTNNFTSPQTYTVTAEDGITTQQYLVTLTQGVLANLFAWTNTASGNWSIAANWTNDVGNLQAPLGGGRSSYTLNFNEAGTYTATNNLNNGFLLNQLNLGGPALTLAGNGLAFAANGATLPQLSQNSAAACTISVPVNLATNTTVGGAGAGYMTLSGALSGPGSLTKTNPGTLQITGAPSQTGGTYVKAGTLYLYAAETGFAPNAAAFNIAPVTVESGATLEGYRAHLVGNLTMNGGRYFEYNGWNDGGWWGPIYLAANSYFGRSDFWCYAQTLGGQISGPGGFTYDSYNNNQPPLTLAVANSYTGPTVVNSGKVVCKNAASLGNYGSLSINSPGVVALNYTGTHFVSALTLDGAPMSRGVYGSSISGAAFPDDTHFDPAGTGTVTVPGPAEIVAFAAAGQAGVIDQTASTINVTVPYGTDLATLAPTFTLTSGTCTLTSGTPPTPSFAVQNPATYTVTDPLVATNVYTVTVTVGAPPIIVGASGSGTLTFDALPPIAEWSTLSVPGGSASPSSAATMDSAMSPIDAGSINAQLFEQANNTGQGLAIWRSDVLTLFTRPTGNAMTLLMATLGNFSGSTIDTLAVSYTLTVENTPAEEVPGHRVYWSKSGAAGSWAALGTYAVATGSTIISFNVPGIAWANGQLLYIVWADDNAVGTEGRYRLDDMTFARATPPPPVITGSDVTYPAGGSPTVQVQNSAVGVKYTLVYKNGVTDPDWTTLPEASANKSGDGGTISLIDTSPSQAAAPHRFYRVWAHY